MSYDLVITGGTLLDPAQGVHAPRDVAFQGGRVAALAERLSPGEAQVLDARGLVVAPGMIDLHVHVFEGVSHLGIPPDPTCLARGATTVVDAGSSGADTFPGFRKYVIEVSATRIYALLNISSQGMLSRDVGELDDLKWANVPRALEMVEQHRDLILGIKVRLTRESIVGAEAGLQPLFRAREAGEAAGLPVMVHPQGAWCATLDEVLAEMRPGDILTHTYHGWDQGILDGDGRIRPAVRAARERGVLFDVGHGAGSFDWQVCEVGLAQGFPPDTISSDLHSGSLHGPAYDLATTVTKFLHLGLSLEEALARVTAVPARVLGMADRIGTLAVGAWGDAVLFALEEGEFALEDASHHVRLARQRLVPRFVVKGGRLYHESAVHGLHVH